MHIRGNRHEKYSQHVFKVWHAQNSDCMSMSRRWDEQNIGNIAALCRPMQFFRWLKKKSVNLNVLDFKTKSRCLRFSSFLCYEHFAWEGDWRQDYRYSAASKGAFYIILHLLCIIIFHFSPNAQRAWMELSSERGGYCIFHFDAIGFGKKRKKKAA